MDVLQPVEAEAYTNKTVYPIFSRRYNVEKSIKTRYEGEEIQKDDAPQYLGLQLDPILSMRKHIENKTPIKYRQETGKHQVGSEQANTMAAVHGLRHATLDMVHNQALRFII